MENKLIRSQEVQLKAILAKFGGDRRLARAYCVVMAREYPALAEEYWGYTEAL